MRSRIDGGYDFPCDPETLAGRQSQFWIPSLQPQVVKLSSVPQADEHGTEAFALPQLDDLDLRQADDGWHALWKVDGITHRFWIPEAFVEADGFYEARLPMDVLLELRAHAARRLWRALNGRRPGPDFRAMPTQLRTFHVLSLRALDARLHGESHRTIAEVLLGFHGDKTDWESDRRRNQARRLVAHGLAMMKGGYRLLLHYPVKFRRK